MTKNEKQMYPWKQQKHDVNLINSKQWKGLREQILFF